MKSRWIPFVCALTNNGFLVLNYNMDSRFAPKLRSQRHEQFNIRWPATSRHFVFLRECPLKLYCMCMALDSTMAWPRALFAMSHNCVRVGWGDPPAGPASCIQIQSTLSSVTTLGARESGERGWSVLYHLTADLRSELLVFRSTSLCGIAKGQGGKSMFKMKINV